jgi:hypothetical protein
MSAHVPIHIAHYRMGKTLGIGSFGKIKRESFALMA